MNIKFLLKLTVLLLGFAYQAIGLPEETALGALKTLLKSMNTLEAHVHQTLQDPQGQRIEDQTGILYLKKPAKIYWMVSGAEGRLIISNGQKIWDFDRGLAQVIVQKIHPKKQLQASPLFFLSGHLDQLHRYFNVQRLAKQGKYCMNRSTQCFDLKAKQGQVDQAFEAMQLGFFEGHLQEMRLLDALGQSVYWTFSQVRLNQPIAEERFNFKIPEGVDVLVQE